MLALHEEKKRFIANWIAEHGTPEQQSRQAAGVLPTEEAVEAITDHAFAAVAGRPVYTHDGAERLQSFLRQFPKYADAVVERASLVVKSSHAVKATRAQWAMVQVLQGAMPHASATLRIHKIGWRPAAEAPTLTIFGVLLTCKVGPFTLRREYCVPGE